MGGEVPTTPLTFFKPNTSVIGPGEPIIYPSTTEHLSYEGELAVVIGRICREVPVERAKDVIFVGHELTPHSRRFLMRGTMDAVINQDPGHEARSAARVLMALGSKQAIVTDQERIRIDIFVRDNLP